MTPEGALSDRLKRRISAAGGQYRKIEWSAHHGAPDLLIMINGRHFFIEMKAPGKKPERHQLHKHEIMRTIGGCDVRVIDSAEAVEEFIRDVCP